MQGAVAGSGWGGARSQLAVPWWGCPVRQPGLLAALPWPLQAHPFMDALCTSARWEPGAAPCSLYIAGPSPGVCGQRQRGLTVRAHLPSCLPLSEPSSHLLARFAPVPLGSPSRWDGGRLRWARAAGLCCVFSSASTSRAPGLRFTVTAHPMSEPLQILPANSYANYLISCLIYFLWHHIFSTSLSPGGCGSPGMGGGRSDSGTHRQGWLC